MNKTVYHIMKGSTIYQLKNQSQTLFPFLDSHLISSFAKQQIAYNRIAAIINHRNIDEILTPKPDYTSQLINSFVFFGRSNVGKSTLLNSLMGMGIAPTSKRPGKTKEILLCQLRTKDLSYFVDAPGYGYATGVAKNEIKSWGKMIKKYLMRTNNQNQNILCLLDITHDLKETDALVFEMLRGLNKNFQLVFTKCDKMSEQDIQKGLKIGILLQQTYSKMNFYVHFTSARNGIGIESLRNYLYFSLASNKVQ